MKFLVSYSYSSDKYLAIVKTWSSISPQERADVGEGVRVIGRWHDVVGGKAYGVLESDDPGAVSRFCGRWNLLGNCVITPVLDDEEAAVAAGHIATFHDA